MEGLEDHFRQDLHDRHQILLLSVQICLLWVSLSCRGVPRITNVTERSRACLWCLEGCTGWLCQVWCLGATWNCVSANHVWEAGTSVVKAIREDLPFSVWCTHTRTLWYWSYVNVVRALENKPLPDITNHSSYERSSLLQSSHTSHPQMSYLML